MGLRLQDAPTPWVSARGGKETAGALGVHTFPPLQLWKWGEGQMALSSNVQSYYL